MYVMWRQQVRADNLTICYCKKQIDISFSCVCPIIDNEFRHNIVTVAVGPQGDSQVDLQTTLTNSYDDIHCQLWDRRMKNCRQFLFYNNKLSNCLLSLVVSTSHTL